MTESLSFLWTKHYQGIYSNHSYCQKFEISKAQYLSSSIIKHVFLLKCLPVSWPKWYWDIFYFLYSRFVSWVCDYFFIEASTIFTASATSLLVWDSSLFGKICVIYIDKMSSSRFFALKHMYRFIFWQFASWICLESNLCVITIQL